MITSTHSTKTLIQRCFLQKQSFALFARFGSTPQIAMIGKAKPFHFNAAPGWVIYPFNYPKKPALIYPWQEVIPVEEEMEVTKPLNLPLLDGKSRHSSLSQEVYLHLVQQAISHIEQGVFEKLVLSRRVSFDTLFPLKYTDYLYLWQVLYSWYPQAFVYLWVSFEMQEIWMGASPELFLSVDTSGNLETHSIAGTLPEKSPVWTKKEYLEQDYVSQHITSVLSRLNFSDVQVLPREELRFGGLTHLASRIKAFGVQKRDLPLLVSQLFPTPAVCGFPKEITRKYINLWEEYDRLLYAGLVGPWWAEKSCFDFYVNIRTIRFVKNKACVYVCGGILPDSDPHKELWETEAKLEALVTAFVSA